MPARAYTQAQLAPTNFAADDSQAEGHASGLSSLPTTRAGNRTNDCAKGITKEPQP